LLPCGYTLGAQLTVVIHYHLFKNAGSSLDEALHNAFGDSWGTLEADRDGLTLDREHVAAWLKANPHIRALSSHTAVLPEPPGSFPIVFIRHPIDRIGSVYSFERRRVDAHSQSAQVARATSLAGWVRWQLSRPPDRSIRSFQTYRLAFGSSSPGTELTRAERTLRRLPFVGLVEAYRRSVDRLANQLRAFYPELALAHHRLNAGDRPGTLGERLESVRQSLGDAYAQAMDANRDDLDLWRLALELQGIREDDLVAM
jgi:hypothetical protein